MNEENTVISSREEHCLPVLPTQVNVRIYAIHTSGPVLAEASANLNGCFTIRGLKVVDVGNGPSFPCRITAQAADTGTPASPARGSSASSSVRRCWRL